MEAMAAQIAQLQRMLFGQKRERFQYPNNQLCLPLEIEAEAMAVIEEAIAKKIAAITNEALACKTTSQNKHKGRLPLPTHLEVVETIIEPQQDTTDMIYIGQEITEELGYQPEKFFIHRIIRKKYAPKSGEGSFSIGTLPERVIEKGIPSVELLTQILVDKYIDHLPLYRIKQRFLRNKIDIKDATIDGWVKKSLQRLEILYDFLVKTVVLKGYLQVDETTLKVQDNSLKAKTHLGYYWVYHNPIDKVLFFEYHPNREGQNVNNTLKDFEGYLQTDGYAGYNALSQKEGIKHVGCMAHARRKFEEAKDNDVARSQKALIYFQALYHIEAGARENNLSPDQRKELRFNDALPIFNALGKWMVEENKKVLPKSKIGQAFQYAINRWDSLSNYFMDGNLEIDNNLIENAIRPIAIGRKNYLFAGSHQAAQRAAMIYTFFGICKKHNRNPTEWLNYALAAANRPKYTFN
jgi:transposase